MGRATQIKKIIDETNDACIKLINSAMDEVSKLCTGEDEIEELNARWLTAKRIANFLWTKCHPHAAEVFYSRWNHKEVAEYMKDGVKDDGKNSG